MTIPNSQCNQKEVNQAEKKTHLFWLPSKRNHGTCQTSILHQISSNSQHFLPIISDSKVEAINIRNKNVNITNWDTKEKRQRGPRLTGVMQL